MNRRAFLAGTRRFRATPRAAAAQPQVKIARIGVLLNTPSIAIGGVPPDLAAQRLTEAFLGRLRELGYVEGRNLAMEYRFAEGRPERFPALASELVSSRKSTTRPSRRSIAAHSSIPWAGHWSS